MGGSVEVVMRADGAVDDPLDADGALIEQLERLPILCRFQYAPIARVIASLFDPALAQYQEVLAALSHHEQAQAAALAGAGAGARAPPLPPEAAQRVRLLEGQLTWLVYIVAAILGGVTWQSGGGGGGGTDPHSAMLMHGLAVACHGPGGGGGGADDDGDGAASESVLDADLSRRVLQLAQAVEYRASSSNGTAKCDARLELALLFYFQVVRDDVSRKDGAAQPLRCNPSRAARAALLIGRLNHYDVIRRALLARLF